MPKWIHVGRYAVYGEQAQAVDQQIQHIPQHPGDCSDANENCDAWAVTGECDKNPGYMVGDVHRPGACLKACNRCDILKAFSEAHKAEAAATQRRLQ
jgi:prolyl 4-hydroxylase